MKHGEPNFGRVPEPSPHKPDAFGRFSTRMATVTGSPWSFVAAASLVAVWLLAGPVFGFSPVWMIFMNTIATVVAFLMVFLIQQTQNRNTLGLQIKVNELLAALEGASNRLIGVESLSEDQLRKLHDRFVRMSEAAQQRDPTASTSIEEAYRGDPRRE